MKKDCFITYHMKVIIISLEKDNVQPENQIKSDRLIWVFIINQN